MNDSSRHFCRFLDQGLVYNNNTVDFTVSPCCYFSHSKALDIKGDIAAQIDQARRDWCGADWSSTCRLCLEQERAGETSYRQASFDMIPEDTTGTAVLTVAVNKQCNLACASCGAESSSFWYQQDRRDGLASSITIQNLHQEDRSGEIRHKFLSVFERMDFENLRYIKFGGGEPLMSVTHELILDRLPRPDQVTVQYTSNFSIEPSERVLDLWSRFRLVKWCASIDGVGQQFELLRWPYRWQDLEEMIDRQWHRVPHNVMFGIEHTLNPLNIFYFDRFQAWFDARFAHNRYGDASDLNLHCCTGELDLAQTPPALRADIRQRLGADHAAVMLMDQRAYSGSHAAMTSWLDHLDRRRNTQWRSVFAEVADYFS